MFIDNFIATESHINYTLHQVEIFSSIRPSSSERFYTKPLIYYSESNGRCWFNNKFITPFQLLEL